MAKLAINLILENKICLVKSKNVASSGDLDLKE